LPADALPTLECACASLRRAARAVTQRYEAALKESGLRVTQLTLLQALDRMGPSSQAALGELLALDATTLSRSLQPLARGGWLRVSAGKDRRESIWTLTSSGRRRLARARPAWERAQQDMRRRVGAEHWEPLLQELAEVAGAARSA
jgi:DNA-binding MarR family transcriptional regulator